MADPDGVVGVCRCACQRADLGSLEYQTEPGRSGCCSTKALTSALLGILACVLVVGGIFLAFHRWDPMWLIVSGIGVVLILIGSILHCQDGSGHQDRRQKPPTGKGVRHPLPPDGHHSHQHQQLASSGNLSEQLLPLSNARSVSQLSLNMLPGYFPPVVSTYGIEQHSAVVQNINRLVQQQQQQQLVTSSGSVSPGTVSGNAGKSFILLSLPADANPASIQNLVATVYQLDGSVSSEMTPMDATSQASSPVILAPVSATSPVLKNAEVQTCNFWPTVTTSNAATVATVVGTAAMTAANIQSETPRMASDSSSVIRTASCLTQTEDDIVAPVPLNLMDCGTDFPALCDSTPAPNGALVSIPDRPSDLLIEVLEPSAILVDVPELTNGPTADSLVDISEPIYSELESVCIPPSNAIVDTSRPPCDILIDVPALVVDSSACASRPESSSIELMSAARPRSAVDSSKTSSTAQGPSTSAITDIPLTPTSVLVNVHQEQNGHHQELCGTSNEAEGVTDVASIVISTGIPLVSNFEPVAGSSREGCLTDVEHFTPLMDSLNSGHSLSSSVDNLSSIDAEVDDGGSSVGRSSPPPSYEDATNESEEVPPHPQQTAIGAFGLGYGTI